jgi:hypothetical protein
MIKQSDIYRQNADNCMQMAEAAQGEPAYNRFKRMEAAWLALAEEQEWLDGDRGQMASRRLPFILAMEIESAGWQANSSVGETQAYPRDEHCQSAVGRIHGELLKLGIDIGQTSVAKYMAKRRDPPSQGWRTFLRNHADGIAAMDMFVVPTISFRLLYGLLIVGKGRRHILWFGVTAHPTAEWIANQVTEACGWEQAPRYLIRDRDGAYGEVFIRRLRSIGIRDRPCACRKSNPNILVVQPAQDRAAKNGPGQFDGARDRRILLQR